METDLEPLQEGGRVYKSSFVGGTVNDTHIEKAGYGYLIEEYFAEEEE